MKSTNKANIANLSRRRFIVGSATVAGGGLALGLPLPFGIDVAAGPSKRQASPPALPRSTRGSSSSRTTAA